MTFSETLARMAPVNNGTNTTGFLPNYIKTVGHILYLLGCINTEEITVTPEQAMAELRDALDHWNARPQMADIISTRASAENENLTALLEATAGEYEDWTNDQRTQNLRTLANRFAVFAAILDHELIGLTDSNAGSTL